MKKKKKPLDFLSIGILVIRRQLLKSKDLQQEDRVYAGEGLARDRSVTVLSGKALPHMSIQENAGPPKLPREAGICYRWGR